MKPVKPVLVVMVTLAAVAAVYGVRGNHGSRTSQPVAAAAAADALSGQRQSRMLRLMESLLPERLHGSLELGPGYSAQFNAGYSRTSSSPGLQRQWWLGDNVCVRNEQHVSTSSPVVEEDGDDSDEADDDEDVGYDVTNDRRFQFQSLHGHHGWHAEETAASSRWRWQAGIGYGDETGRGRPGAARGQGQGRVHTSRQQAAAGFRRTCEEVTRPTMQYRCTTETRNGRSVETRVTIYECCNGYQRAPRSNDGCNVEVLPDVMGSLKLGRASEMARAFNVTGLVDVLGLTGQNDVMRTVFAPTDAAFANFTLIKDVDSNLLRVSHDTYSRLVEQLYDVIGGHVVDGRVLSSDMTNELLLPSALSRDLASSVRINRFSSQRRGQTVLTANCVPLTTTDIRSSNGVVHVVDRVLPIPLVNDTVESVIQQHPQLTVFASVLDELKSGGAFDDGDSFTIFAPTDQAFARLPASLKQKLTNNGQCAAKLARQHLLSNTVCLSAVSSLTSSGSRYSFNNVDQRPVYVTSASFRAESRLGRRIRVEEAGVIEADLMASNGVVHVIDGVLFNHTADIGLFELASTRSLQANLFVELIEKAGLRQQLESRDDFTIFLPTNNAVEAVSDVVTNMTSEELRQLIEYHIVPRALPSRDLLNDLLLTTSDQNRTLLVKDYHSFPFSHRTRKTVGCAVVRQTDVNTNTICGGGIGHVIDSILKRPMASIVDLLSRDPQFSRLMSLVNTSGLTAELSRASADAPITFFAPNNNAFDALPESTLRRLGSNVGDIARRILRSHIIPDALCCAGVFPPQFLQLPVRELNVEGWLIEVNRNSQSVTFDQSQVTSCDIMATNGIVHAVSQFSQSAIDRYTSDSSRSRTGILDTIQELIGG